MSSYERLETFKTKTMYPQLCLTPVIERNGDFIWLHHIDMEWPEGEGAPIKYVPLPLIAKQKKRVLELEEENAKQRAEQNLSYRIIGQLSSEGCDLIAENAKLRELVKLMWEPYCFAQGGCGERFLSHEEDVNIREMIWKLGIEVCNA